MNSTTTTLLTIRVNKKPFELEQEVASWLGLVWLLRVGVSVGLVYDKKSDHTWRCDPHTVWSRDYKWIAFNGMPDGNSRQVMIAYIGDDLHRLFHKYQ